MLKNHYSELTGVYNFIRTGLPLLAIFFLALILRIYNLDGESYWLDEFYSVQLSRLTPPEILNELALNQENTPPVYYVLLHFWTALFGESEFATRLLSAVLGSFSVFLIYLFGKELMNKNTGLLASIILAVSPFQVYYSQEARTYTLLVVITLINNYFFFRLLSSYNLKLVSGYLLSGALLIYTHYFWVFYIAAQNIYIFTKLSINVRGEWPGTRRWVLLQFILLVIFLPGLQLLLTAHALSEGFWIERPNIKAVVGTFLEFSGSYPLLVLFFLLSLYKILTVLGTYGKSALGQICSRSDNITRDPAFSNIDRTYLLIVLLFVPVILPFLVSVTVKPVYIPRYMIGACPALFILVSAGIDNLKSNRIKIFIVVLIAVLSLLQVYRDYQSVDKHQWRDAAKYLDENAARGDLIVVSPDFEMESLEHYLKRTDLRIKPLPRDPDLDFDLRGETIWVISAYHGDRNNAVNGDSLNEHNTLLSEQAFTKIKIYHLTGRSN